MLTENLISYSLSTEELQSEGLSIEDCQPLKEKCSSEWLVLPEKPIMFGLFQFINYTNRTMNEFEENIQPDLIYHKNDFHKTTSYSKSFLGVAAQRMLDYTYKDFRHCELWPCHSPYVHCDKIWDCPNALNEHECTDDNLKLTHCLPINQIAEIIRDYCDTYANRPIYFTNETIINENIYYLWNKTKCLHDGNLCYSQMTTSTIAKEDVCLYRQQISSMNMKNPVMSYDTGEHLCHLKIDVLQKRKELSLTALRLGNFPVVTSSLSIKHISTTNEEKKVRIPMDISQTWFCHRGILLLSGIN
ncbi:hypothetical protein I4U23_001427 [Adineta vaga]|nr:hypothetical protein I4U23_001427 [Adineta vaga]